VRIAALELRSQACHDLSALPRLQSTRQLADDRILDAEIIDLFICPSFRLGHKSLQAWRGISSWFVRLRGFIVTAERNRPTAVTITKASSAETRLGLR
jgi:hypothetical protein